MFDRWLLTDQVLAQAHDDTSVVFVGTEEKQEQGKEEGQNQRPEEGRGAENVVVKICRCSQEEQRIQLINEHRCLDVLEGCANVPRVRVYTHVYVYPHERGIVCMFR